MEGAYLESPGTAELTVPAGRVLCLANLDGLLSVPSHCNPPAGVGDSAQLLAACFVLTQALSYLLIYLRMLFVSCAINAGEEKPAFTRQALGLILE